MTPKSPLKTHRYLAENIRRAMIRLGLTQADVVERCGVDRRTLRKVLHGRDATRDVTLQKLAAGLGVSEAALLSDPTLLTKCGRTVREELEGYIAERPWLFVNMPAAELDELVSLVEQGKRGAAA
jgi:transcriptional regulator with XRE-family HTH domain